MPSYYDTFGPLPRLSAHAWRRLRERGIALETLRSALDAEPRLGTTDGTVIYGAAGVEAVVDDTTGIIVTI